MGWGEAHKIHLNVYLFSSHRHIIYFFRVILVQTLLIPHKFIFCHIHSSSFHIILWHRIIMRRIIIHRRAVGRKCSLHNMHKMKEVDADCMHGTGRKKSTPVLSVLWESMATTYSASINRSKCTRSNKQKRG